MRDEAIGGGGKVSATMHHVRNVRVIVNHDALDAANNDFSRCSALAHDSEIFFAGQFSLDRDSIEFRSPKIFVEIRTHFGI